MIVLLALLSCATVESGAKAPGPLASVHVRTGGAVKRLPTVAYRPEDPKSEAGKWMVSALHGSQWDGGLAAAASELIGSMRDKRRLLSPRATATASSRAGFPGAARFAKTVTDGARPVNLVNQIAQASGGKKIDVGLASRQYGDGQVLWVVGWAPHVVDVDPVPRTVTLDSSLTIRIENKDKRSARLFVVPPDGPVEELSLSSGVARWVDGFDVPGEYRFEVLLDDEGVGTVALLFSVFADGQPPAVPAAPLPPERNPDPREAEAWLMDALNKLRVDHGLRPVQRFTLFDTLAREHSAMMGHMGVVAHRLPGYGGVTDKAANFAHPRAAHHENVAAAPTAQAAMKLVELSPAHLQNLLCEECTHVSIGATLEPVLDRIPRLFVTWELLEFPQGPPKEIDHYNR